MWAQQPVPLMLVANIFTEDVNDVQPENIPEQHTYVNFFTGSSDGGLIRLVQFLNMSW
jgi:hypothetical protein